MPQIASGKPHRYSVGSYFLHVTSFTSLNLEKGDTSKFCERKNVFCSFGIILFITLDLYHYSVISAEASFKDSIRLFEDLTFIRQDQIT